MKPLKLAVIMAAATLLLAGCGGSSNEETVETPQQREDRAASSSIDGLISFLKGLIGAPSEQAEPRPVGGITPPVSESSEPQVL
jgi:hypothetical protein